MRVLIVSHGHPELSAGGAEIASYALFGGLKFAGVEAFYLARDERRPSSTMPSRIVSYRDRPDEFVFHSDDFDRFLFSQRSEAFLDAFRDLLERLRADVIHIHHYVGVGLEIIRIARLVDRKTRIVLTLHEFHAICHHAGVMMRAGAGLSFCAAAQPVACARCYPDRTPSDFAERKAHIRSCFDAVDLLIAPSAFLRDRYVAWGVPDWQIVVLENAIDLPPVITPPRAGRDGPRDRFAYFGQIHPYKGLLELLAAFARIAHVPAQGGARPSLTIHGASLDLNSPGYVAAFRSALAGCGKAVDFVGPYERAALGRLMAQADWVVVPSIWWENSPLVIEEALAHRRPVICSQVGGMAEKVRDGLDGFHFEVGNSHALAALIVRLTHDPKIWDDLQATMRKPVALAEAVSAHLQIYDDRTFSFA